MSFKSFSISSKISKARIYLGIFFPLFRLNLIILFYYNIKSKKKTYFMIKFIIKYVFFYYIPEAIDIINFAIDVAANTTTNPTISGINDFW